jgi:hypothetical protein
MRLLRWLRQDRLRLRNPRADQDLDLPDVALVQSRQLAQLAPRVMPELIVARGVVDLVLKDAGEPADNAKLRGAFEQRALRL